MKTEKNNDWIKMVTLPPGSGMSVMANQVVLEQVANGGTIKVVDVGQSS